MHVTRFVELRERELRVTSFVRPQSAHVKIRENRYPPSSPPIPTAEIATPSSFSDTILSLLVSLFPGLHINYNLVR